MISLTIFVVFFFIGIAVGIVKLILGDTAFYTVLALIGVYVAFKFFSFFGFFVGGIIIVAITVILLMGMFDIAEDFFSLIFGRK